MTPKQENHNQTYTCQAQNTADRAYRAASIQIEVNNTRNSTYHLSYFYIKIAFLQHLSLSATGLIQATCVVLTDF